MPIFRAAASSAAAPRRCDPHHARLRAAVLRRAFRADAAGGRRRDAAPRRRGSEGHRLRPRLGRRAHRDHCRAQVRRARQSASSSTITSSTRARKARGRRTSRDRVKFLQQDFFKTDFSQATVVTLYLLPAVMKRLRERMLQLKPGTRLVAHDFDFDDWRPDAKTTIRKNVFLWIVPAQVARPLAGARRAAAGAVRFRPGAAPEISGPRWLRADRGPAARRLVGSEARRRPHPLRRRRQPRPRP